MTRNLFDYEESEKVAIDSGKRALERTLWLFNRVHSKEGFFAELRKNDAVHPNHYSVHCVDGNGTKLFLSAWSGNYKLAPIDGGAMNANDMATLIHVFPDSLNIYMSCQTGVEEEHMGEIMEGFVDFAERIRIPNSPFDLNIGKLETASLDEMISLGVPNKGVDFGIAMTGFIEKDKVPNLTPKPGHVIVGVSSSGLHSNGYIGARHTLLSPDINLEYRKEWREHYNGKFSLDDRPDILKGKTILEALQVPTALYLVEAALVGQKFDSRDVYGVNITGNGVHNFNRAGHNVSFEITDPLPIHPIQELLIEESGWDPRTAYIKQNMGMGFAYIVPTLSIAESIVELIASKRENQAQIIGEVGTVKATDSELRTTLHKPYEGIPIDFIGYSN